MQIGEWVGYRRCPMRRLPQTVRHDATVLAAGATEIQKIVNSGVLYNSNECIRTIQCPSVELLLSNCFCWAARWPQQVPFALSIDQAFRNFVHRNDFGGHSKSDAHKKDSNFPKPSSLLTTEQLVSAGYTCLNIWFQYIISIYGSIMIVSMTIKTTVAIV